MFYCKNGQFSGFSGPKISNIFSAHAFGARGSVSGSLLVVSAGKNFNCKLMRLRHFVDLPVLEVFHAATVVDELQESRTETFANNTYMYH